jgi:lysozyme
VTLGIDISHHSGERDWHCLLGTGIEFVFVKATEGGTFIDHLFERNRASLHAAGIPCGAYHYAHPGTEPVAQAAHFCGVVGALAPEDLQPVLDLEVDDGQPPYRVVDWTLAFLEAAEARLGTRFILYTGGFWRRTLGNPACAPVGRRKLWVARYGGIPIVPRPWNAWSIWQFSDGIHSLPPEAKALDCHCDWNRLADNVSLDDLTVGNNHLAQATPAPVRDDAWPGRQFVYPSVPPVTGDDVRKWQARMCQRGWAIDQDGEYGPQSRKACLSLQRHFGLVTDGIVGCKTWMATFSEDD